MAATLPLTQLVDSFYQLKFRTSVAIAGIRRAYRRRFEHGADKR